MLQSFVLETLNNPGAAATANLLGAVTGFDSFLSAYGANGACFYTLTDGTQREEGFGTVTAGTPNVLNRTTVIRSTNGGARVNFTGTVRAYSFLPASETFFRNPATAEFHLGTTPMGPLAGLRNLIINGNPTINQRGYVSGTAVAAANTYTLDRWRVVVSGQSVAWTDSSGVRTVTAPAGGMEQVIEGASILPGVHTVSWTGTATCTVNGTPVASGDQVNFTGGSNVTIRLSGGTWSRLQVERGGAQTAFERRPIGVELMLCQRYYWQTDAAIQVGGTMLTGIGPTVWQNIAFPVAMRAVPTASPTFSAGSGNAAQGLTNIGRTNAQVFVQGNGASNNGFAVTLNAGCTFSAEL